VSPSISPTSSSTRAGSTCTVRPWLAAVAGAWLDSTPCLFVAGQVKRADLKAGTGVRILGVQEIDSVAIVKSITKYAVTILDPATIRFHLEKAAYLARSGRKGPVWIDIPLDVQAAQIDPEQQKGFDPREVEPDPGGPLQPQRGVRPLFLPHFFQRRPDIGEEALDPRLSEARDQRPQRQFSHLHVNGPFETLHEGPKSFEQGPDGRSVPSRAGTDQRRAEDLLARVDTERQAINHRLGEQQLIHDSNLPKSLHHARQRGATGAPAYGPGKLTGWIALYEAGEPLGSLKRGAGGPRCRRESAPSFHGLTLGGRPLTEVFRLAVAHAL